MWSDVLCSHAPMMIGALKADLHDAVAMPALGDARDYEGFLGNHTFPVATTPNVRTAFIFHFIFLFIFVVILIFMLIFVFMSIFIKKKQVQI